MNKDTTIREDKRKGTDVNRDPITGTLAAARLAAAENAPLKNASQPTSISL